MSQLDNTPEGRLIKLAMAIIQEDTIAATALIEEGVPLAGKKISLPLSDGSCASVRCQIPESWLSEGLSPLTWVVSRMLQADKGESPDVFGRSMMTQVFQMPSGPRARTYSPDAEKTLESLSHIGGAMLAAGASADTRMGRTARSQKAIEALKFRLPEYAGAFQSAANRRRLQGIQKRAKRSEIVEEPYRPKM